MNVDAIDRLIAERFAPKRCRVRRGRCECGHIDLVHERITDEALGNRGRCGGSRGRCSCEWFVPYGYEKEQAAFRDKLREFAIAVLRAHEAE